MPIRGRTKAIHTARHSAYRSQFVVVAYPWHPLYGQRVRVYGRQGRAGRQILYIEVRPGLSREIPAWMCDAAACAVISIGSSRVAVDALTELRAILDTRSVRGSSDESSTPSTRKGGSDETSGSQSIGARSRGRRKTVPAGPGARGIAPGSGRHASGGAKQAKQHDIGRAGGA